MSGISTHVLDTARGLPAVGVGVTLERSDAGRWTPVGSGKTDADGRVKSLLAAADKGTYRLRFDTGAYLGPGAFFPCVEIIFAISDAARNHHVPLLLSPFGYSTYRGS